MITLETELKLDLDPSAVARLMCHPLLAGALAKTEELDSVYFDTDRHALHKDGFSLRIRHIGDRRVQTIKADQGTAAGLFVRPEWEREIDGDVPVLDGASGPLAKRIKPAILDRIVPVFRTIVTRTTLTIIVDGSKIELSLDRGEIVSTGGPRPLCEVELELKTGHPAALFALARQLDAAAPMRLGVLSKAERGYHLVDRDRRGPVTSEPVLLARGMTVAAAFQAIAHSCIRQFRLNEMLLAENDNPFAVHHARVGLRRLVSAMSLFKEIVSDGTFGHLKQEIRWIDAELGEARDIDVLIDRIDDDNILDLLRDGRRKSYARVAAAIGSMRLRRLMLHLGEWLLLGNWIVAPIDPALRDQSIGPFAADRLAHLSKGLRRRGANLVRLDDRERHKARIAAKNLRYAGEFFTSLYEGKRATRRRKTFLDALETLQDDLGDLNDRVTAPSVFKRLGLDKLDVANAATDFGQVKKLLGQAEEDYNILSKAKRFWK